jgi:NAD(P)-dependent dehydrogenase (short-subunit alcohol dehydrogenase family)
VIQNALKDAELKGEDVSYIECHGTGTALGDPIETRAIKKMYGKGSKGKPLILGAVKSNIGHLEGAAGVAGLTKMIMAMKHRALPPNLHLKNMNPNIDLEDFPVLMPAKVEEWNASVLRAGISSFGFSGTNAHAILEEAPRKAAAQSSETTAAVPSERNLVFERKSFAMTDWARGLWYSTVWEDKELAASKTTFTADEPCLIIGGGDVVSKVQALMQNVFLLQRSNDLDLSASPLKADLTKADHVTALLKHKQWKVIAFADALTTTDLTAADSLGLLVPLFKGMAAEKTGARFVMLTCGASKGSVEPGANMARGVAGGALWGLMRSLPFEVPTLKGQVVDFSANATEDEIAQHTAAELAASEMDGEVAYVAGSRRVPRLREAYDKVSSGSKKVEDGAVQVSSVGTYLITGGLGGLGLITAQKLVDMGARSVALVSRSGKVPQGQGLEAHLERLESSPATIHNLRCDVSDAAQVAKLLEQLKQVAPDQPLRGVIHAAGILDFCELNEQTAERMDASFKPKCEGAWHLHEQTKSEKLDVFLVFSSISALVGLSRGLSYSAANAFLDSLVEWRRAQGLAATSIQWGSVAEVGMANRGEMVSSGDLALKMITPKQVQIALEALFSTSLPSSSCSHVRIGLGSCPSLA